MTTASTVIQDALTEIIVIGAESSVEAADSALAIRKMNQFMNALESDGVSLNWTDVDSTADDLTIAAGLIDALTTNLAVMLSPSYGATPSPFLLKRAQDGMNLMLKEGITIIETDKSKTLPIGSGNEGDYFTDHFYPIDEE